MSGLRVKSANVTFQPVHGRRLADQALYFVKVTKAVPGYVAAVDATTLLVRGSVFESATAYVTAYAPLVPLNKYDTALQPAKLFIIRAIAKPLDREGCDFHADVSIRNAYWVKCSAATSAAEWAAQDEVYSIDQAPAIRVFPLVSQNSTESIAPLLFAVAHMKLAVSDTGLDVSHCSFDQAVTEVRNIPGWTDTNAVAGAHGTSTASVAVGKECIGVQGYAAGAPLAFCDLSPVGGGEALIVPPGYFDICLAAIHAYSESWGLTSDLGKYPELSAMKDEYHYENQFVPGYVAAGNGGEGVPASAPSTSKNVMSCGALNPDGITVAPFTSTGPLADGRTRSPLIYAPGVRIWAAMAFDYPPGVAGHADFVLRSGTSFATPILAALGLIFQEAWFLAHAALPHASLVYAYMLANYYLGRPFRVTQTGVALANGVLLPTPRNAYAICFALSDEGSLSDFRLAVSWIDVPSMTGTSGSLLINDLDVLVQGSGLKLAEDEFHANELFQAYTPASRTFRVLVYAYGNHTLGGVNFSAYAAWDGDAALAISPRPCGTCFPGEVVACEGGQQRQCLPTGEFTDCSPCALGYAYSQGLCACSPDLYVRSGDRVESSCGVSSSLFAPKLTSASREAGGGAWGGAAVLLILACFTQ